MTSKKIKIIRVFLKHKPTPEDDLKAMRMADRINKTLILPDGRIYRPNQEKSDDWCLPFNTPRLDLAKQAGIDLERIKKS